MPVVTALKATRAGHIAVHLDGAYDCTVTPTLLARLRIHQGLEMNLAAVRALHAAMRVERALTDAHRLLAHRQRSRAEVVQRLMAKGHEAAAVEEAVARLRADGLLNDLAFAAAFVADRRRSAAWGVNRIRHELARLGVSQEHTEAVLGEPQADDELRLAVAALCRQGPPRPPLEAAKRRAFHYLHRRGFERHIAYRAVLTWAAGAQMNEEDKPGGADDP